MKLHTEWEGRLNYWLKCLKEDFYTPLQNIEFEGFSTFEQLTYKDAQKKEFSPIKPGTAWGQEWEYLWLRGNITLPEEAEGEMIVLEMNPGNEATLFVNGKSFGTKRHLWTIIEHHYIEDNILCEKAAAGTTYQIVCEAYAGHYYPEGVFCDNGVGPVIPGKYNDPLKGQERKVLGTSTFGIWNEYAYQLWINATTLKEVMENLTDGSLRASKIAEGLKAFTIAVDFEQPRDQRIRDYQKGLEILKPLLEAANGTTAPTMYAVGNSHLDVAWLWPIQETIRKTSRTFAQQLRMIERYPEYKFLQSQPYTYQMCKEHYPELYERIKTAVKEGRWIIEGGMWIEPDTNISSGESLIRQLLYGMKFFEDEFQVRCQILWLPDTFGYSAVLPQILKGFGISYMVTQKIFWSYNKGEPFPYHYFEWQGMDGSKVVSYLPTSYTYQTNPQTINEVWENRVQKEGFDKFLYPFGYGDGGGGPTRDYIEFIDRQKDLEGAPKVKMAHPIELFKDLEKDGGPRNKYVGELYFCAHRGVYTSQAKTKKGNRKCEFALRESEMWSAFAAYDNEHPYPFTELEVEWKKVLLNQFHDILPGSSIARVYIEANALYEEVLVKTSELTECAKRHLITEADQAMTIFNSLSWDRTEIIKLPPDFQNGVVTAEGDAVESFVNRQGVYAKVNVPSCGFTVLLPANHRKEVKAAVSINQEGNTAVLENSKIRVVLNEDAEITSYILKSNQMEYVSEPMNRFKLYKDVPRLYDAWDIDSNYIEQPVAIEPGAKIEIIMDTPLKVILGVEKKIGNSLLTQQISLCAQSDRIEFDTTVNWSELHRLLKVSFPVNVTAEMAVNEIQYGYIKRPVHRSRQYDKDRFEVCNHKYTVLCDESHGAAVLNDCKYGVSVLDNNIELTLLRAPAGPAMRADNEVQSFRYGFTAWSGTLLASEVVRQGYELNVPVQNISGKGHTKSFIKVADPNIIVDHVKCAEDGSGDIIVRLYESKYSVVNTKVSFGFGVKSAFICDMSEQQSKSLEVKNNELELQFSAFQIITLRIGK